MSAVVDQMLILKIARYYYNEHFSQQQIATLMNIDRSQVSRYLKYARENGYVKIDISLPDSSNREKIEKHLEQVLGLRRVLIAPTENSDDNDENEALYIFAANYLENVLPYSHKIGIGWGKTLYNIAVRLSPQTRKSTCSFCSLTGLSGIRNPYLQTNSITDRFAQCFNGESYYNNFLCYIHSDTMTDLDRQRLDELRKLWAQLDTVVMSLGGVIQVEKTYLAELPKEIDRLNLFHVMHGDILGNFFLANHGCYHFPDKYIIPSMNLDVLRNVPNIICIAAGNAKVKSIISAAKQGYIKTLLTDDATSKLILATLKKENL